MEERQNLARNGYMKENNGLKDIRVFLCLYSCEELREEEVLCVRMHAHVLATAKSFSEYV